MPSQPVTNPIVDPMVGRTVAQYEILARRGGGGMGVVYEARDTKLGRIVALKFLPPQWSHDASARERFLREAQAASATDHPNICTIHDIETTDDGRLFIVMAYYAGDTLKQRLAAAGALPVADALDIATQIADGIARAHAQGVVHRDIKPGNVILTADGVRIVDFGLATFADALQLTIEGSTLGTAAYMSPEQVRGEQADSRTDVWAVGVMLYEMLAGHVPFRGTYPEAIAYAIRHDAPAPLREARPEIPEEVEQLVFRALHKDPAIRFQNGRELARALRQARGQTIPLDLTTRPVSVPERAASTRAAGPGRSRLLLAAAGVTVATLAAALWWLFGPRDRVTVVVAPVANQTGYADLDPYRLALTQTLIRRLESSPDVRPISYTQMLPVLRRFVDGAGDPASRDAVELLARSTGATVVIVPVVAFEAGKYYGRLEFRDPELLTPLAAGGTFETDALASSFVKEAAYELIPVLARAVEARFASPQSRIRSGLRATPNPAAAAPESVEIAADFERGIRAYEELELSTADDAFEAASRAADRHPVVLAWKSRVALLLGDGERAGSAAREALGALRDQTPNQDAAFARAVAAEAAGDREAAEEHYRSLVGMVPDEPRWLMELAAFQDRLGETEDAVATYDRALQLDAQVARPRLELCRLNNSTRMNQAALARTHGQQALERYAHLGDAIGEAQARLCLADVFRNGDAAQRAEARRHAELALAVFERRHARYNLARAQHYVALAIGRSDLAAAVSLWEQSLATAEAVGNRALQTTVLTNLGVSHEALGRFRQALEYYRRSFLLNEQRGDHRRAAYSRGNAGALLISYGDPTEGLRDVQSALSVVQKLNDRNFEAFCRQLIAAYHRFMGEYAEAMQQLNLTLTIARELGDADAIASATLDIGRVHAENGEYTKAEASLREVIAGESGPRRTEARIALARLHTTLGLFDSAETLLEAAADDVAQQGVRGLLPSLHLSRGELAYESGRRRDALEEFGRASALWGDDLPDAASVEARSYLGVLEALDGRVAAGAALAQESLDEAQRRRRPSLVGRAQVALARIAIGSNRGEDALAILAPAAADRMPVELRAHVHYWRSRAYSATGDAASALRESEAAHRAAAALVDAVPPAHRSTFDNRSTIVEILKPS